MEPPVEKRGEVANIKNVPQIRVKINKQSHNNTGNITKNGKCLADSLELDQGMATLQNITKGLVINKKIYIADTMRRDRDFTYLVSCFSAKKQKVKVFSVTNR